MWVAVASVWYPGIKKDDRSGRLCPGQGISVVSVPETENEGRRARVLVEAEPKSCRSSNKEKLENCPKLPDLVSMVDESAYGVSEEEISSTSGR